MQSEALAAAANGNSSGDSSSSGSMHSDTHGRSRSSTKANVYGEMAPLRYANQRAEDEEEDYDSLNTANMMFEFNKIVAADLRKSNDPAARR